MIKTVFKTYEEKLVLSGLTETGAPLFGFLDAALEWNRNDPLCKTLETIFNELSINSLLFSMPAEPYRTLIEFLAKRSSGAILPQDCETRTFLHELPVCRELNIRDIIESLKKRKCVIVPNHGIITHGTVSLEQTFVTFSSVCFACFVKFFSDVLYSARHGKLDDETIRVFNYVSKHIETPLSLTDALMKGPFDSEANVLMAMEEAGRLTVDYRLVDSYFGNISCRFNDILYISQTGSSLDNLKGYIDPCPLDGSSCAGITASSELAAHMAIIKQTGCKTILHGHPKFSVILSMDCDVESCDCRDTCHINCQHERNVCNVPVVSGEVGTGVHGLCHTVPNAIIGKPGVIVYGHGLFTTGMDDFNEPFGRLLSIENKCRMEYFKRLNEIVKSEVVPIPNQR